MSDEAHEERITRAERRARAVIAGRGARRRLRNLLAARRDRALSPGERIELEVLQTMNRKGGARAA